MKKTVAFLLMACMVMQLSACGSKEPAVLAEEEIKAPQVLSMEKALVNIRIAKNTLLKSWLV